MTTTIASMERVGMLKTVLKVTRDPSSKRKDKVSRWLNENRDFTGTLPEESIVHVSREPDAPAELIDAFKCAEKLGDRWILFQIVEA
jgi:hypothetical protein